MLAKGAYTYAWHILPLKVTLIILAYSYTNSVHWLRSSPRCLAIWQIIYYIVQGWVRKMDTANESGLNCSTQGMVFIWVTPCIISDNSSIRPFHVIAVVGKHRVQVAAVRNEDSLKSVLLNKNQLQTNNHISSIIIIILLIIIL